MLFGRKSKAETPQISRPMPLRQASSASNTNATFYGNQNYVRPSTAAPAAQDAMFDEVLSLYGNKSPQEAFPVKTNAWQAARPSTASSVYPSSMSQATTFGRTQPVSTLSYSQSVNLSRKPTLVQPYYSGIAQRHRAPVISRPLQTQTRKPVRQGMWLWRGTLRNCKDAGRLNKQEREMWDLAREEGIGRDLQRAVNGWT